MCNNFISLHSLEGSGSAWELDEVTDLKADTAVHSVARGGGRSHGQFLFSFPIVRAFIKIRTYLIPKLNSRSIH